MLRARVCSPNVVGCGCGVKRTLVSDMPDKEAFEAREERGVLAFKGGGGSMDAVVGVAARASATEGTLPK